MTVKIEKGRACGTMVAPPSKSMAHRLLICGAFSEKSIIKGIDFSEDINATLDCLRALGAMVSRDGSSVCVGGFCPEKAGNAHLSCRESGSTLRFFLPLCLLSDDKKILTGAERLFERPLSVYEKICEEQGLLFLRGSNSVTVGGTLKSGEYRIRADISSQFITGLMLALSRPEGDSKIILTGKRESRSYIALTVKAMRDFGVVLDETEEGFTVYGGQSFLPKELTAEGDYSNAAFFDAFNEIGGDVTVTGLDPQSLQGDRVYKTLFGQIGGEKTVDLTDCPDLAPILFALAAVKGTTQFTGTARLKIKESDRAEAMRSELSKFGVRVDIAENSVTVYGGRISAPTDIICGHNDHRIVMAMSLLCTLTGGEISNAEAVSKSLPDYFKRLSSLNIKVEEYSE